MKTDIANTPPCGLVLVVEGGKGYSLDPGSGVEGATHCTRLHLGRREGREGNLQNKETQCLDPLNGIWLLLITTCVCTIHAIIFLVAQMKL